MLAYTSMPSLKPTLNLWVEVLCPLTGGSRGSELQGLRVGCDRHTISKLLHIPCHNIHLYRSPESALDLIPPALRTKISIQSMYAWMYVCIHVCMHACMYACMYTYVYKAHIYIHRKLCFYLYVENRPWFWRCPWILLLSPPCHRVCARICMFRC
jgi:hypothetical protein